MNLKQNSRSKTAMSQSRTSKKGLDLKRETRLSQCNKRTKELEAIRINAKESKMATGES